jgi:hypothetical protein
MEIVMLIDGYEITLFGWLFFKIGIILMLRIAKLLIYSNVWRLISLIRTSTFIAGPISKFLELLNQPTIMIYSRMVIISFLGLRTFVDDW